MPSFLAQDGSTSVYTSTVLCYPADRTLSFFSFPSSSFFSVGSGSMLIVFDSPSLSTVNPVMSK